MQRGRLPEPASAEDAAAVVSEALRLVESSGSNADLDEDVLKLLAFGAAGELNPMAAMFGGIIGQEVGVCAACEFGSAHCWPGLRCRCKHRRLASSIQLPVNKQC